MTTYHFVVNLQQIAMQRDTAMNINSYAGVTVGFSQSLLTVSEGDDLVRICAELLEGELGTDVSLLVEVVDLGNNTGMSICKQGMTEVMFI